MILAGAQPAIPTGSQWRQQQWCKHGGGEG